MRNRKEFAQGARKRRSSPLFLGPLLGTAVMLPLLSGSQSETPAPREFTNSVGMRMIRIEPGSFWMGTPKDPRLPTELTLGKRHFREGDFDERPVHRVTLTRPYYMGATEVTNAQYEQFDPEHRKLRGKLGFSREDDEAVVFVSWEEAVAFTRWLSDKEGKPYRLPTEAEWEYAARAGTTTPFFTGDTLPPAFHKNVRTSWYPHPRCSEDVLSISLRVGATPPNAWGLHDIHGNVEEWCYDWYGPYDQRHQVDPVGRLSGDFKVTRGGSHSTELYYLRSSNRSGTLPEDKSWLIGFRVVMGDMPSSQPLPPPEPELYRRKLSQSFPSGLNTGAGPKTPYFKGPRRYVKIPPDSYGPLFSVHNHDPAIVECPNGDLLAIWYTCVEEPGRELGLAASRLRYGAEEWEPASVFWDAPDRNDHAPALWYDGNRTLYHFVGLSAAATWGNLALVMRTSQDNGATWSKARLIVPEHGVRHMPVESVIRLQDGTILLPSDAVNSPTGGGTALWLSEGEGKTWYDPGGTIAGIHAGVVELKDGRLMALGRGDNVVGKMPKSVSADRGKSWHVTASPFPPISGGQRLALLRLREGPIFVASFADELQIRDASGKERTVSGLFAALSYDEGETWDIRRLISDDGPGRWINGGAWTGRFLLSYRSTEPKGYLSVCQTSDGLIHLISSAQHYSFNLSWLQQDPPPNRRKSVSQTDCLDRSLR